MKRIIKLSTLSRVFRSLVSSLLAILFIVTTVSPTFCPVTSPAEQQVYVTDTPSKLVLGATRSQCALECGFSDKISGLSAGGQPGCRCFNHNSTSANCSIFTFEPTSYDVDQEGNTVAYQFTDRPLQGLWRSVSQSECAFPFSHDGLVYWQCKNSIVFVNDWLCVRSYNWCKLSSGEPAFCSRAIETTTLPSSALNGTDCTDIAALGKTDNGVYTIYVGAEKRPLSVYCDMKTANSSWTVFQRRMNGSVNFYRPWNDYVNGFGSLTGEFWLGNDNLTLLTSAKRYKLRVDLTTFDGNVSYAEYDNFKVASYIDKYRLVSIGTYKGTAGDSLVYQKGQQFSTYDEDNDQWSDNCAVTYKGAWWYNSCHWCNLNGYYHGGSHNSFADGVEWKTWTGLKYSLKTTEMKIRPA